MINKDDYIKVPVKTYYLEMNERPKFNQAIKLKARRLQNMKAQEYLKLYRYIGDAWGWTGRLLLAEQELETKINNDDNHVLIVEAQDQTVGMIEMEFKDGQAEIVYFGLHTDYIGKGYGKELSALTFDYAWSMPIKRLWLHTCEYDHPKALGAYLKMGFQQYGESIDHEYYPKDFLDNWKDRFN